MSPDELEIEKLNRGRLLRDASSHLLPLLLTMKEAAVSQVVSAFKGRKLEELPALAAELSCLSDLITKITSNNKDTEKRERKLYGE